MDNLALCHGDFHTGAVMVDGQQNGISVKVIDPEFAIYGPAGLDVGCLISGYVLACVHRAAMGANSEGARPFLNAALSVCDAYGSAMRAAQVPETNLNEIFSDAVGFAGCEVARNALHGLPITDMEKKGMANECALALAVKFIKGRAHGVDVLMACLLYTSPSPRDS